MRTETIVLLIGGEPFTEQLLMWWNFIGRTHEEIVEARNDWEAESERFGYVDGHDGERIPAPPMPNVRLTPRRRRSLERLGHTRFRSAEVSDTLSI